MERDYYQILEVPRDASEKDIKRAYHRLARERHPDKGGTPEQVKQLQEEFSLITTAYNILKDKDKRAEYDARLRKDDQRRAETGETAPSPTAPAAAGGSGAATTARPVNMRERAAIAQRAFARGQQLFNAGDYARACEFFEAAIKNDDSQAIYHARLALALLRSHKGLNRADSAVQRAIELDPYNIDHRLVRGEIYETVGSKSKAIATYQEILKWDPTNAKAIERLTALGAAAKQSLLDKLLRFVKRR
ncbi:MAG: DnaJ domain-containing protein [Candidatus Sumerlaeia bacterium]|nr:DnaJ domain-containing protein [Candidatus Sumerlaeia bacterium]